MRWDNRSLDVSFDEARSAIVEADPEFYDLFMRAMRIYAKNLGRISWRESLRQAHQERPGNVPNFTESPGLKVDPESVKLCARAHQIEDESQGTVSFGEALRQARQENPTLREPVEPLKADPGSVNLCALAHAIQDNSESRIDFGEALRQARQELSD
jgi:hypothetical protein